MDNCVQLKDAQIDRTLVVSVTLTMNKRDDHNERLRLDRNVPLKVATGQQRPAAFVQSTTPREDSKVSLCVLSKIAKVLGIQGIFARDIMTRDAMSA